MGQLVEVALEIDVALKEQAEKVFAENGLTLEQATILFFEETVRLGKLPFELDEDMKKSMESGMNGHYSKPIDFIALRRNVGAYLRRKETR